MSIVGIVKNKLKSVSFGMLICSLLTVLVGSAIFFHAENADVVSYKNQVSSVAVDSHNSDEASHRHEEVDPCGQGFCHLGHCAKLVFSSSTFLDISLTLASPFHSKIQREHERVLDGPDLPPRSA